MLPGLQQSPEGVGIRITGVQALGDGLEAGLAHVLSTSNGLISPGAGVPPDEPGPPGLADLQARPQVRYGGAELSKFEDLLSQELGERAGSLQHLQDLALQRDEAGEVPLGGGHFFAARRARPAALVGVVVVVNE